MDRFLLLLTTLSIILTQLGVVVGQSGYIRVFGGAAEPHGDAATKLNSKVADQYGHAATKLNSNKAIYGDAATKLHSYDGYDAAATKPRRFFTNNYKASVARPHGPPAEAYWRTVLPDTTMPNAIQELLHQDVNQGEDTPMDNNNEAAVKLNNNIADHYGDAATKLNSNIADQYGDAATKLNSYKAIYGDAATKLRSYDAAATKPRRFFTNNYKASVARPHGPPAEAYWRTVLPDTAMPNAIQELLHQDVNQGEDTSMDNNEAAVKRNNNIADQYGDAATKLNSNIADQYGDAATKLNSYKAIYGGDAATKLNSYKAIYGADATQKSHGYIGGVAGGVEKQTSYIRVAGGAAKPQGYTGVASGVEKPQGYTSAAKSHGYTDVAGGKDRSHGYIGGVAGGAAAKSQGYIAADVAGGEAKPQGYIATTTTTTTKTNGYITATDEQSAKGYSKIYAAATTGNTDNIGKNGYISTTTNDVARPHSYGVATEVENPQGYEVASDQVAKPQGYIAAGNGYISAKAASSSNHDDDPRETLNFVGKDLYQGSAMALRFVRTTTGATFLAREEADSIPFSTSTLPDILAIFSVNPNTIQAEKMRTTIQGCELPPDAGEVKRCVASLESMLEFSLSTLGTCDVHVLETRVGEELGAPMQQYRIASFAMVGSEFVACHIMPFAYPVYFCHRPPPLSEAYTVALVGEDGVRVEATAVCHTMSPGTDAMCHFLPQGDLIWMPNVYNSES